MTSFARSDASPAHKDAAGVSREGRMQTARGPIQWTCFGAFAGLPLLFLHGTPGSRLKFVSTDQPGRDNGVTIVAPDRWGYGGTTAPDAAAQSLAHFADDMVALMARLGFARFAVAGVSGGGPFAVAVAAYRPQQVSALCLVSPVGLVADPTVSMSAFHRFCFGWLALRPHLVRGIFDVYRRGLQRAPLFVTRIANLRAPAVDTAILARPATAARLVSSFQEGLRNGAEGPAIDLALFRSLDAATAQRVRCPTRVVIGDADTNVPPSAARALADAIPGAKFDLLPRAGHLWVADNYADIIGWVRRAVDGAS